MTQDQRTITAERDGYDFDLRVQGVPVTRGLALSLKVCSATTAAGERIYVGINADPFVLVSIDPARLTVTSRHAKFAEITIADL